MVKRHWAWHAIIALGRQTQSNNARRDMPSPPLDSIHDRTTSGMTCHHHLWAAHMIERRRVRHAVITFRQHKRSNDVGRGMPSSPLGSTHDRTTPGVACHHRLWATQTVKRRRAWHDLTALGLHARSDDVGHGMTSQPSDITHGRTTSGVALHHRPWTTHKVGNVGYGLTSSPLDSTHGQQRRAWHDITALGQHTRSAMSGVA